MDVLDKMKKLLTINAIVYVFIGIIMILVPGFVNSFICYLIGILVSIFGISITMTYFAQGHTALAKGTLIVGLALSILGIYIVINPKFFSSIIPFMAGVLILVESIDKLKHTFELKKNNYDKWYIVFISAIILFALALVLLLYPFESVKLVIRVIGIILLVDALSDVITLFSYKKTVKPTNAVKIIDME